jgi:hypothetical protein
MWNPLKKSHSECDRFREALDDVAIAEGLPAAVREHATACADCEAAVKELLSSRELLSVLPRQVDEARPWFAPRVMAAIAAREAELRRSLEAWIIVPSFAAKLTWVSALALVLASTWLFQRPAAVPTKPVATDITGEPEHENTSPANDDDVLLSLAEAGS